MRLFIHINFAFCAFICGCQSSATAPNEIASETEERVISEGTYAGDEQCDTTHTEQGATRQTQETVFVSRDFGLNGMILFDELPLEIGQASTLTLGNDQFGLVVASVMPTSNGVEVTSDVTVERACRDSCTSSFDGICDEPDDCELGTDCFDCGPVVLTGISVESYQAIDENKIGHVRIIDVDDESNGLVSQSVQCQSTLSK